MQVDFKHIFSLAVAQNRLAQKEIYDRFSGRMLSIAKSYAGNTQEAEDIVVMAFCKAFSKIAECRDAESFPFWLRKIVVNDAITLLRKEKNILYTDADFLEETVPDTEDEIEDFADFDVDEVLAEMPLGYKLVFNLYVFEDKKHQEISEILNISEGTSKSQYSKAKKWLFEYFKAKKNERVITK